MGMVFLKGCGVFSTISKKSKYSCLQTCINIIMNHIMLLKAQSHHFA